MSNRMWVSLEGTASMSKVKNNRITLGTFDFIKGFAMIVIVFGHTISNYQVWRSDVLTGLSQFALCTRSCVIPLFFLISGFGFKPKDPKVILKKLFFDMIIPYLWIVAAYALIMPVMVFLSTGSIDLAVRQTLGYVVAMLLGNTGKRMFLGMEMPWWMPSWYLLATFVSINVLNQILRLKKVWHQIAAVCLSVVAGYGLFHINFHYYCIPHGLMAVGFCYGGYALKKFGLLEKLRTNIWTYVILVPVSVAEAVWGLFDLCPGDFNNVVLDYIGAGGMALLVLLVGIYLGRLEWPLFDGIKSVGVYTYWIVCIHCFEQSSLPWWMWREAMVGQPLLGFVIEIIARALFLAGVCIMLKKFSKYRYKRKLEKNAI